MSEHDKLTRVEFDRFVNDRCSPHMKVLESLLEEDRSVHAKVERVHTAVFGDGNGKEGMEVQLQTLVVTSNCNKDNVEKLSLHMFGCDKRKIPGMIARVDEGYKVLSRMNHWLDGLRLLWIGLIALVTGSIALITLFRMFD